jgi:hypothetical protein
MLLSQMHAINAYNRFAVLSVPHPAAQPQALNMFSSAEMFSPTHMQQIEMRRLPPRFTACHCCVLQIHEDALIPPPLLLVPTARCSISCASASASKIPLSGNATVSC